MTPQPQPPSDPAPAPKRPQVERSARLPRLFLWLVAIAIVLVILAGLTWRLAGDRLLAGALVPDGPFSVAAAGPAPDHATPAGWAVRPGKAAGIAGWRPPGVTAASGDVAIFFVPPTVAFGRAQWNERSDAADSADRLAGFLRIQATALADAGPLWVPHYRQAVLGSFLASDPEDVASARAARDLAYQDVKSAFAAFLAAQPKDAPIILAGHSQGSLHLMRLMAEQVAGQKLAGRVVAAYLVGWPISIKADLPALGLPACAVRGQPGCLMSWQSFAEPAEPKALLAAYAAETGLVGWPRANTPMLCSNPLTGGRGDAATANPGSLVPAASLQATQLVSPGVPARCDPRGLLLIGAAPSGYPAYVLPGNNFHVFDYPLFWASVRADVAARVAAWKAVH